VERGLERLGPRRFDDVDASLRDRERLSNERRQESMFAMLSEADRSQVRPLCHYFAQKDVIASDPPDHTRMRAIVQRAFTPRMVAELEPRIAALAAELVAEGLAGDRP
jgi:cytochrome P450